MALIGQDCSRSAEHSQHLFKDPTHFSESIQRRIVERTTVLGEEFELVDDRCFERDYVPVFDGQVFRGHLWNYRDVTARKTLQRQLQARLVHADRLASLGQLAAGVAHEINNPAAYILANLVTMREQIQSLVTDMALAPLDSDMLRSQLLDICTSLQENITGVRQIRSTTRSLKRFSRPEGEEILMTQLNDVIENVVKLVSNEVRHRAQLILHLEPLSPIPLDRAQMSQVFLNLITNAAHAIDHGHAFDNTITIRSHQENETIVVTVEDTGHGIHPDHIHRVFEPFFTTKSQELGTGLGLSLVADIVRRHQGTIHVQSQLEQGSIFRLSIPCNTGLELRLPPAPQPHVAKSRLQARILIIDDERAICTSYQRLLGRYYDVEIAKGGREALSILERDSSFDTLICDLMMPDMDGPEFFRELQQSAPHLIDRVIFWTGGAFTPRTEQLIRSTSNLVLEKPVEPKLLLNMLDRWFSGSAKPSV